ncbi:hypothetical protein [Alteromonas sp. 14N.309.X.WAT.G.H12]|uniref:hypothetical protein n=1 Tax=Alteromonas sp. 14N.309.X.WAT.G.H12 TaxID=3120824 RepID=UPI002FD6F59A
MQENVIAVVLHGIYDHEPQLAASVRAQVEQQFQTEETPRNIHYLAIHWLWMTKMQPLAASIESTPLKSEMDYKALTRFLKNVSPQTVSHNEVAITQCELLHRLVEQKIQTEMATNPTLCEDTMVILFADAEGEHVNLNFAWKAPASQEKKTTPICKSTPIRMELQCANDNVNPDLLCR